MKRALAKSVRASSPVPAGNSGNFAAGASATRGAGQQISNASRKTIATGRTDYLGPRRHHVPRASGERSHRPGPYLGQNAETFYSPHHRRSGKTRNVPLRYRQGADRVSAWLKYAPPNETFHFHDKKNSRPLSDHRETHGDWPGD